MSVADPSGCHIWFDPKYEVVKIYTRDGVVEDPDEESGVASSCERDDRGQIGLFESSKKRSEVSSDLPF